MKNVFGIIFLIWLSISADAQKMPADYFEEGIAFLDNEEPQKAIASFQYIIDNHPKNELYPRAFYNVGYIYYQEKEYDKSIEIFKTILIGNFHEKEPLGGDIMADPYANYRHRASLLLYQIYFETEDYDSALYYLGQSDSVYKYMSFCGNAYAEQGIRQALEYAVLYDKIGNPNKAVQLLLPHVFVTLANNSEIITELKQLLQKESNSTTLINDLDAALRRMKPVTKTINENEYTRYYFQFRNTEIQIPSKFIDTEFNKEVTIKKVEETEFYKMVKSL